MSNRVWLVAGLVTLMLAFAFVALSDNSAQASQRSTSEDDVDLSNPDVAAIAKLAKDIPDAIASGDVKRAQDFYSPDAIKMVPGQPDIKGKENMWGADFLSKNRVHVVVHLVEVKVFGDLAYDRATFTTTVTPKSAGEAARVDGRLLEILRKERGKWKSYRVMYNSEK